MLVRCWYDHTVGASRLALSVDNIVGLVVFFPEEIVFGSSSLAMTLVFKKGFNISSLKYVGL
ncbi:hypothetical protein KFK09_016544 [Dendrobium nobile]|uniref:Uncharacterized protein n=1 Tax=Dendrobium nobile TaxID=94219 RepID=A0A8T3AYY9_DENNO|nr:hypothetical protein KFK09_016544 [Dendrobium nobile]